MRLKVLIPIAVVAVAVAVIAGIAYQLDGQVAGTPESRVQEVVKETIRMYDADPGSTLERISAMASTDPSYPFVINPNTATIVAHGAYPYLVGTNSVILTDADRPAEEILADLERNGHAWAGYQFANPQTGGEGHKRSWLVLHDGYIFGSGYYKG